MARPKSPEKITRKVFFSRLANKHGKPVAGFDPVAAIREAFEQQNQSESETAIEDRVLLNSSTPDRQ